LTAAPSVVTLLLVVIDHLYQGDILLLKTACGDGSQLIWTERRAEILCRAIPDPVFWLTPVIWLTWKMLNVSIFSFMIGTLTVWFTGDKSLPPT